MKINRQTKKKKKFVKIPLNYQGLLMQSSCDITYAGGHEVYVKEEPWCPDEMPIAVKCEECPVSKKEMVSVSLDDVTESKNNITIHSDNKIHFKGEIKEEYDWVETSSVEISCKSENPFDSNIDLQSEIKKTDLHSDKIAEDVTAEVTRLHTESMLSNTNSASCFFTSKYSEESNWVKNDPNVTEESQSLNSSISQMHEDPETNNILDSDMKKWSSVQRCKQACSCRKILSNSEENILSDENRKVFKCKICEKSYNLASDLKRHKRFHEAIRPHKCDICEKSFFTPSRLKEHKAIHEGKRSHTCDICDKSFIQASNLKQHKLAHEDIRQYKCEVCEKNFIRLSHLKEHKLMHEGERLHECEICKMSFTRASNLKQHKLTHEGKRPYTCEICKKGFTKASNLIRHQLIHLDKKPYSCEICNQQFTQVSHMKRHKLTHKSKKSQS